MFTLTWESPLVVKIPLILFFFFQQLRKCHSASSTPKSTPAKRAAASAPISAKAQEAARARTEARRRLIEAKKAGRQQRKTSETDESVEIYVA